MSERERLSQTEALQCLERSLNPSEMVTVYLNVLKESRKYHCIYSALIPSDQIDSFLRRDSWGLEFGDGLPGTIQYYANGEERVEYHRFGNDARIEPLVIYRKFHDIYDSYVEINEEFRLFHNLYHNQKAKRFIKLDKRGEEHEVAVIEPNQVKIRLKEIQQFLAIKEMHLSIQFDCREFSNNSLQELDLSEKKQEHQDGQSRWHLSFRTQTLPSESGAFSRLYGKRLIAPLPKSKSGMTGFSSDDEERYERFILGLDKEGNKIEHTCDPGALGNYDDANPDTPNFLTPVSFRKQVLDKYYQNSGKFKVSDGYLRCGSLWGIDIDNHHDDKVCAWLGDLGRLAYEEQLHWKSHNIESDTGASETFMRRQICSQFTDSSRPEHIFFERYNQLNETSQRNLGWQILLPLKPGDQYHLKNIRVPATDDQRNFDPLVLGLAMILVDSLYVAKLKTLVPKDRWCHGKNSIWWLETALRTCDVNDAIDRIGFLRNLQSLRSSGAAHRKGENYEKALEKFGFSERSLTAVYEEILECGIEFLEYLIDLIEAGRLAAGGCEVGT